MKQRFWLFQRGGVYYLEDSVTRKKESLHTSDRREAERLRQAKNQSFEQPSLNLALGRAYLSAHDPQIAERTWAMVMEHFCRQGTQESTRARKRREMARPVYNAIRPKRLIETTAEDLLRLLAGGGTSTLHYTRRLHNFARRLGWLVADILDQKTWPKVGTIEKRGITEEEHERIIAAEKNIERRNYYRLLWEIGAAQSDAARLEAESIDLPVVVCSLTKNQR